MICCQLCRKEQTSSKLEIKLKCCRLRNKPTNQHILKYNICRSAEAINVVGICYNYRLLHQIDILPFDTPGEIQQEHIIVSKIFACLFDDSNQLMLSKISWHFYLHLQNMLSKLPFLTRTEMWQNCALISTTLVVHFSTGNIFHYAQFADKLSIWLILILHETSNIMIENSCNKIFLTLNLTYS